MRQFLVEHMLFPAWEARHGGTRLRQLRQLRESQWWSNDKLRSFQEGRLRDLYAHAVQTVPHYSELAIAGRIPPELNELAELQLLPTLGKQDVRRLGGALISTAVSADALKTAKTGGSTGTALNLYLDKRCEETRNAADMRSSEWAGKKVGEPFFALWGNMNPPSTPGEWFRDRVLNGVSYVDTMAINDGVIGEFVERWRKAEAQAIFGHAHSIYIVASRLGRAGIRDIRPKSIVATSMMLLEPERRVIEEVFRCRVTNRYGCEEVGLIAAECEMHDGLHVNAESVIVEILREDGTPEDEGNDGEVVVTDLNNLAMPLIRYRIEDRSAWSGGVCKCGRPAPRLRGISGRVADFLKKRDGTLVAGVSLVERTLTAFPGIEQLQIVQNAIDEFELRVVPGEAYTDKTAVALGSEMARVFGEDVIVNVTVVRALERTGREKFRFAICRL